MMAPDVTMRWPATCNSSQLHATGITAALGSWLRLDRVEAGLLCQIAAHCSTTSTIADKKCRGIRMLDAILVLEVAPSLLEAAPWIPKMTGSCKTPQNKLHQTCEANVQVSFVVKVSADPRLFSALAGPGNLEVHPRGLQC